MISHALTIVINELDKHLTAAYGEAASPPYVKLGNLAEGFGNDGKLTRDILHLSLVNIKEEKTLKNLPNFVRNDVTLKATYENPPVFLTFQLLLTATHSNYTLALTALSRAIRFFQFKNVFTQDNVTPDSMKPPTGIDPLDELETFKLIFDLYSPTMEEVNHLWGTLGGKQYPFVMYMLRMLELKFKAVQSESGLITEVISEFYHKNSVVN
jgi:Pvc16 N-terminal domain